jgi:hypothetical protein
MSGDKSWFWTLVIGMIYVAILYVLVKPGSNGANAVKGLSNALANLVSTATGGTPATDGNTNVPTG